MTAISQAYFGVSTTGKWIREAVRESCSNFYIIGAHKDMYMKSTVYLESQDMNVPLQELQSTAK